MLEIYPLNALINTIITSGRPLSILVGSPISIADKENGFGVPSVNGIIQLIENKVKELGCLEDYQQFSTSENASERYQKGFSFIRGWVGQDTVNEIINNAVKKSYDESTGKWYIPDGIKKLTSIISSKKIPINTILTTNFDPLIEESLRQNNIDYLQTILDSDGKISQTNSSNKDVIRIVHLHGFWEGKDTLHTPDQLVSNRNNLKASIRELLSNTNLLVLAYGGWDDIFIKSLESIMFDESAGVNISWAFYESDENIIQGKYKKLLDIVSPAITKGRFKAYGGVDFKRFLGDLNSKIECAKDSASNSEKEVVSNFESIIKKEILVSDNPEEKILSKYRIGNYQAHSYIRVFEQERAREILRTHRVMSVFNDWGMGRDGFISSVINSEIYFNSRPSIYRVDLEGVSNTTDFNERFIDDIGVDISVFILKHEDYNNPSVLLLDNVSNLENHEWRDFLRKTIHTTKEFTKEVYVVLSGGKHIADIGFEILQLKALDYPDIISYIKNHPDGRESHTLSPTFETICRLSGGLPLSLDSLLSKLKLVSIDELLEMEGDNPLDTCNTVEPMPLYLSNTINGYLYSDEPHKKQCIKLLKILSFFQYGETYSFLKRFDPKQPFSLGVIKELNENGLISSEEKDISINTRDGIPFIHKITPLVASYIKNLITSEEAEALIKRGVDMIFGDGWLSGNIRINNSAKESLTHSINSGPGNAHILIFSLMKISIETNWIRGLKSIFNVALSYFSYFIETGRYKDLVISANEILSLVKETPEPLPVNRLHLSLAEGYRMIGDKEAGIKEMEIVFSDTKGITKSELAGAKLEVALAYDSLGQYDISIQYAKDVLKTGLKGGAYYMHAESLIAMTLPMSTRDKKLRELERNARRKGHLVVANNIALNLASREPDLNKKIEMFDKAISDNSDGYTRLRAVIKKSQAYIDAGSLEKITLQDLNALYSGYSYLYAQRLDGLLRQTHEILWKVFLSNNNIRSLAILFKYSSLIWRLRDDSKIEERYANQLSGLIFESDFNKDISLHLDYAKMRLKILTVNIGVHDD
ncbi:TPA: SIR2 family protein [Serratia liquefaciens]|nr:SIR2 family protein [Serratia liquefaciens]